MVLQDLGRSISGAIRKLTNKTVIDEAVLDDMLKEISVALMQADVNIRLISSMRKNVKGAIPLDSLAAGVNRRALIEQVCQSSSSHVQNLATDENPLFLFY